MGFTRREFLTASALCLGATPFLALGANKKVVVVGGGIGGATAAKQIQLLNPAIEVTLIEPKQAYYTCFMSNEVLSGQRSLHSIRFNYTGLKDIGITLIHDIATNINADKKTVSTKTGRTFSYDRCIIAPGIDFKWETIAGYDTKVAAVIPHAWQAGQQTKTLREQLEAMPDGGTVIIAPPSGLIRAPHAPYERASQIALYLQQQKPKSKVLILDAKEKFPQMGLFLQAWKTLYGYGGNNSLIEWHGGQDKSEVVKVDAASNSVTTAGGNVFTADVLNIIPAQRAGKIAQSAGLTDASGWCPIDPATFESTRLEGIHIIGDASIATSMHKLGSAASSQAMVCASAVVALLNDQQPETPSYLDVAYSTVGNEYAFSTTAVYRLAKDGASIMQTAGGSTPADAHPEQLKREAAYAHSWFNNFTANTF
ncbi:Flavocytochrome c:sulfide dehydrogenase [hydrothermal vent metagenome]|uniref:Flavocytochrome c:sulfide dehydrogenase n=1 Tax=hydrothermal vent metagenome TaxID=652676 RepID=A0A3B1AZ01_9ZZZZ